jgi:hypothetical protein
LLVVGIAIANLEALAGRSDKLSSAWPYFRLIEPRHLRLGRLNPPRNFAHSPVHGAVGYDDFGTS